MSMLTDRLNHDLETYRATVASFSEEVAKKPAWTLDGCDRVFEYASRMRIIEEVLKSLANAEEKKEPEVSRIEFLLEHISQEQHSKAKWPQRSTSITSNLSSQCYLAALSEMLEMLKSFANGKK